MEVQLCEDSIFNIERCNWADEVEDSMELELLSNSTTGSEMSTTCSLKKSEPAVPLNLLRLGQQQRERVGLRAGCGRLGSSGSGKEEKKGGGGKKGKKSRGGRGDGKGCGGGGKERGRKKGGCDVEQSQNRGDLGSSCNTKAIHQYLLDCGGGRREQGGSLGSSSSLERQRSGRADTSSDWNADKGKGGGSGGGRRKRFGSGGRGASGSGSSTARSGGSTARSVASRADTEEWTRPLRVKPDSGKEEPARHTRADGESWKRSGGRRKESVEM